MARFYGTVQGGRGRASRLGHASSGLYVTAQSYSGDVRIRFYDRDNTDYVHIAIGAHAAGYAGVILYEGPIEMLLDQSGRKTLIQGLVGDILLDEAA